MANKKCSNVPMHIRLPNIGKIILSNVGLQFGSRRLADPMLENKCKYLVVSEPVMLETR